VSVRARLRSTAEEAPWPARKKLNANVNVDGVMYGPDYPDNEVTAEVAKAIENPNVWGDSSDDDDA
jgi:hypothetical protein